MKPLRPYQNADHEPRSACQGKAGFASLALAKSVARRMQSKKGNRGTPKRLDTYSCSHCGLFHIGNFNGWRR